MNACRRSGSARPSSFLAFFHDSLRRCRTARIVSRQHLSPKRSRTPWTRRRKGQRGGGSAPSRGGGAAGRWGAPTTPPRSASRCGQKKGGGRPWGGTGGPPCAGRRRPPRRVRLRAVGKKGTAAARAAERERVRALGIVGVHPLHHGVSPPARAHRHLGGAAVLGDVKQSQRPLTGAGVGGAQGQMTQVLRCLAPARAINT